MKCCNLLLLSVLFVSCNTSPSKEEVVPATDNIVRFGEAIQQAREVKLSELVDSIELIPLETTSQSLLRETSWYTHTPPYICVSGNLFDYTGKHIHRFGRQGQGPCEEPYMPIDVLYNSTYNMFLTKVSKLLLYNDRGVCTGVERRIKFIEQGKNEQSVNNRELYDMAVAGNCFVFNNNNDSLVWIDIALQDVKTKAIPHNGNYFSFCGDKTKISRLFTCHNDSTLMYNGWNDTIYRVTSSDIEPRWIMDLGEAKIPEQLRGHEERLNQEAKNAYRNHYRQGVQAKWEELDIIRLTKDKKGVWAVYETDDYLFMIWSTIEPWAKARAFLDKREYEYVPQVGYYNKHTGEAVAVDGSGFVDDILFTGSYLPKWGVFDNCLMQVVWPFRLRAEIEEKQARGEKIHPRIVQLLEQIDDEDNPLLMVAHLKNVN
ncbi:MAG: 6-bladed beta-propeller [Tannerellaceae bacterium]